MQFIFFLGGGGGGAGWGGVANKCCFFTKNQNLKRRWSGGAKVLGKPLVPGRPTNLDNSRARTYCACSRCGWGLFGHFFSSCLFFLMSFSHSGRRSDIDCNTVSKGR